MCLFRFRDRYEIEMVSPFLMEVFSSIITASSYACPGGGGLTIGRENTTSALRDMNMARSAFPLAKADVQGVVGFMILCASTALVNAGRVHWISPSKVPCSGPPVEYIRITARGRCPSTSKDASRLSRVRLRVVSGSLSILL